MFSVQFPLTESFAPIQFDYFETDSYFQQSSVKPQKKSTHWTSQEDELFL